MVNRTEASHINDYILSTVKNENPKTVQKLLKLVQKKYSLPKTKVLEQILALQRTGKLTFKEDTTLYHSSLTNYLKSSQSYWYWITITIALATTIIVFVIPENTFPLTYSRYLMGSIFIVFLPGYALIKTLFPNKELTNIEQVALSIGLSLALVSILGLILNYTPWGIRTTPITLSLLALTTILATIALIREHQPQIIS